MVLQVAWREGRGGGGRRGGGDGYGGGSGGVTSGIDGGNCDDKNGVAQ